MWTASRSPTSEKPAGVASARALLATTTQPASAALDLGATYVRPDGQIVGTGQQIADGARLGNGIWQAGDGTYFGDEWIFTGSGSPALAGTAATTCNDWTATDTGAGTFGIAAGILDYWDSGGTRGCGESRRLYCVEE